MKKWSKYQCQRAHAKRRARERYGVELSTEDLSRLVNQIQKNKSVLVERQSLRVSVHDVDGYRVVYDRNTKEISTFLPKDEPVRKGGAT